MAVFAVLKQSWDSFLANKQREFEFRANNVNIASLIKEFMDSKGPGLEKYVKQGFEKTGLYPWNVNAIEFDKLLESCRERKDEPSKCNDINYGLPSDTVIVDNWPIGTYR